ncbi:ABC transporter ATP-binding protein [Paenibacillus sp. 1P07SE]|uniref:ABC transporter ATP-binding protein n=1 Tax=Paenibacillus sp. 1P07SE TaxID=3132209 RepID=UPI0039A5A2E1
MNSPWMIETTQLTKRLGGKTVVDRVDMLIQKGEIYGFLGPNGAGKTTTIRMLLGLAKPSSGQIRILGKDIRKDRIQILRNVGSLVEYPSYYGHLSGYENLEAVRLLLGTPKSRIDEVLAIVRLTKDAKRPVKGYSLGMKQRLGIATALLGGPELLILDEPTNGLDPAGILEIRELIKSLPRSHGVTILISSHLLSEVDQMATRVGIITGGRMIFQDSIDRLRKQAQSSLRFRVSEPELAARLLLSLGCQASVESGIVTTRQLPDQQTAAIAAKLIEGGHMIYRIEESHASLESIFLEMTGTEGSL